MSQALKIMEFTELKKLLKRRMIIPFPAPPGQSSSTAKTLVLGLIRDPRPNLIHKSADKKGEPYQLPLFKRTCQ